MARDYDYLFKLLIIGDSGKATPGMPTGSGPVAYFDRFVFALPEKCSSVSTAPALSRVFSTAHCGAFSRDKSGDHCNVHLRHVSVALTGRRWCVRAGCVSRSGRISPSDLQHLPFGYILVLSVAARFDLCSKRGDCCRNNLREPPYFSHLASGYLWLAT